MYLPCFLLGPVRLFRVAIVEGCSQSNAFSLTASTVGTTAPPHHICFGCHVQPDCSETPPCPGGLPQRLLFDRQRPLVQWLGLGVLALVFVEPRQIVQGRRRVRVVWPQRLLVDRQRPLVQWLGLGVLALVVVEQRQIVQGRAVSGWSGPNAFSRSPTPVDTVARPRSTCPGCRRATPDCSGTSPCPGGLAPTPSRGSPTPVDTVARPRSTCPGFRRATPDCSRDERCPGGLVPTPSRGSPAPVGTAVEPSLIAPFGIPISKLIDGRASVCMKFPNRGLRDRNRHVRELVVAERNTTFVDVPRRHSAGACQAVAQSTIREFHSHRRAGRRSRKHAAGKFP